MAYNNNSDEEEKNNSVESDSQNNDLSNQIDRSSSTDVENSPVSSFSPERRRSSDSFRKPDLPKSYSKLPSASRPHHKDELASSNTSTQNGVGSSSKYVLYNYFFFLLKNK